jgi:hypothetical protein
MTVDTFFEWVTDLYLTLIFSCLFLGLYRRIRRTGTEPDCRTDTRRDEGRAIPNRSGPPNVPATKNNSKRPRMDMDKEKYIDVGIWHGGIIAAVTFFGSWIYCASTYGFLFGFGLGWLPSGILAAIVCVLVMLLWLPLDILIVVGLLT